MLPLPRPTGHIGGRRHAGVVLSKVGGVLIALGAAASLATPAAGQSATPSGLSFDITGSARYNSNELRLRNGEPTPPGEHKDDIRYSPAIGASYEHNLGRQSIDIHAQYGHDFYQNNSSLSRDRINAGGELTYRVGARCSGVANVGYSRRQNGGRDNFNAPTPDQPLPTDPADDVGRIRDNVQAFTSYGINANCGSAGGGLSFGGSARRSELRNAAELRKFADSNSDNYSLFAGVGLLRPGQLQIVGSYSTIDYPNREIIAGIPVLAKNGVKTYRVGLNYSRPIGNRLSGSLGVAYLNATPQRGDKYSAPAYNVSLSYTAGPRLSFDLVGSRNIVSTSTAGALYRVVDQVSFSANYKLGTSITTHARASYLRNNFKQTFVVPGDIGVIRTKDSSTRFGVGATYAPRPLYNIGLDIDRTSRSSNPSLYDYNSTLVSLSIGIHF